MFFSVRNFVSLIDTIFSRIFEKLHKREIGRKLFMSVMSPDLKIGITFAILNLSGTIPVESERLKTCSRGTSILLIIFFTSDIDTLFKSRLFLSCSWLMA